MTQDSPILNLDAFIAKHGKPENTIPFDVSKLKDYQLPNELVYLWSKFGLSSFGNGFFWLVDPIEFLEKAQPWLSGIDKPLPFLRTAFGDFFFWGNNDVGHKNILTGDGRFYSASFSWIFSETLEYQETLNDIFLYDLYLEALPRLGLIERDECYGFFPPIAMGGEIDSSKLQRVKLREHLAFLSQL